MSATPDRIEQFGDRMATWSWVRPKHPDRLPVRIDRHRIYILPTGFGVFIVATLAAMLLGGLNYNNNPALFLVFLLGGVAFNSLVQAHLLLSGVRLASLQAEPVFAGQTLRIKCRFEADGARERPGLELLCGPVQREFDLAANQDTELVLELPTQQRGWLEPGRWRLSTLQPFGLARAWSWLRPDTRFLVYPRPDPEATPLPETTDEAPASRVRAYGELPHHLRDYYPGDAPRQIAWKASARADRLLVREYEAATTREIVLDWHSLSGLMPEAKIRRLARWVLEAERSGRRYSLHLPGQQIAAGHGFEHRHACLRALALLPR